MQHQCALPNCTGSKSDRQPLFRFPRDPARSKKWVESCQRSELIDKSPDRLYRYYRLCGKHFEAFMIDKEAERTILKNEAIPTIFDVSSQSSDGQMKRTIETTKDNEIERKGRKKMKKSEAETSKEDVHPVSEEELNKEYLKVLFEVLILLAEQGITPAGCGEQDVQGLSNFQALLEYRINCGTEALKKRHEENKECSSSAQLNQLIEVCEQYLRSRLVQDVKQNGSFSIITDDFVKISEKWFLPVFVRFVDQSNCQQERFFGFLNLEGDGDVLTEKLLSEITESWGLDMEHCRAQAHFCSATHFSKIKAFSAAIIKKYPRAMLTMKSTYTLNMSLASGMALSGVQLVLSTFKNIESFFSQSHLLQVELQNAISIFYPDKEEKANELKEICCTSWTTRHDAFALALEMVEALLLCVDSVHDNEDMRWSDQVTHDALEISKAITDFEFIMALVVLKNITALTCAFEQNVQGTATDVYFAATSLKALLHTLKEVSDHIDVYHEFWNDEAVNLAAAMEIPVKIPRSYLRKHQAECRNMGPDVYYKNHLSVLVVEHVINQLNELFCDEHLRILRGLSLVPAVIEQSKSTVPDDDSMQVFQNDIPNSATLSAELHCWLVKWRKKGKGESFASSLHETLQLADVKFFPNVLSVFRLMGILPTVGLEDNCDVAFKRYKMYIKTMPDHLPSKSLAFLNINYDVGYDLDSVVELYMKTYPDSAKES